MTPAPQPQWTDEEVMKEIEDAFDRGIAAAEETIDMKKHEAAIRNATLDELIETTKEDFTEDFDGDLTITYGDFLFNVNSLRGDP